MNFEFATADRILFGRGVLSKASNTISGLGKHALVVTGSNTKRAQPLLHLLESEHIPYTVFNISGEPTIELATEGVTLARSSNTDFVISFGGGSVLDAGKAIAALITNEGHPLSYLEVIGEGKPLVNPPLPFIAIPTTSGTGAEVTKNAVLKSTEHNVKVSLRHPLMLANLAVVDPELTISIPPHITASTGMDALTQVLEPFVSVLANPLTDGFCREGLRRVALSLNQAYSNGEDIDAREDMALASLLGGLALANAKLGAVHGFAGPLGGMYPAPHGAVCARLLPLVMESNIQALQERDATSEVLQRYDEIARILTGDETATAHNGATWVQELSETLQIPGLATFGVKREDFPTIIEKSANSSSMKGNPIKLPTDEMERILERAL